MLVFGSVARGEADRESDIDVVAVFDDIGDYRGRYGLKRDLVGCARQLTDREVDVFVTDRPEWEHRTRWVSSSFEVSVARHAVLVVDRPPVEDIDWGKRIGLPADNRGEALARLNDAANALLELDRTLEPGRFERKAREQEDRADFEHYRHRRMVDICRAAQMVIESSLKAVICLGGTKPARTHEVTSLTEEVPAEFLAVTGPLQHLGGEDVGIRRRAGTYVADLPERSLAQIEARALQLAVAACDVSAGAAHCVEAAGGPSLEIERALNQVWAIRSDLDDADIVSGP